MTSVEVERALIGALLIDGEAVDRIAKILQPEHFRSPLCRRIFEAVVRVRDEWESVDFVTVLNELGPTGEKAIGGSGNLVALINCCPTSLHAEHYARMIASDAQERPARWLAQ